MTTLDPARVHVTPADAEKLTFLGMRPLLAGHPGDERRSVRPVPARVPARAGVPMHIHHAEPESMYVIEGGSDRQPRRHRRDVPGGGRPDDAAGRAARLAGLRRCAAQLHFTVHLVPDTDWETMFRGLVGLAPTDFEQIKTPCAVNRIEFLDPPQMP